MKKYILVLCFSFFILFQGFSFSNEQKIWETDSEVFDALQTLSIQQGKALPFTDGPWSTAELLEMLDSLESGSWLYSYIYDQLTKKPNHLPATKHDNLGFDVSLDINLEGYLHTNTDKAFQGRDNWIYGTNKINPFFQFNWETYATPYFYSFLGLDLQNSIHAGKKGELGTTYFSSNILFLQDFNFDLNYLSLNFPSRALVSFGGTNWSLMIGKDRLSWGNGQTGNFAISDTIPAHHLARFATFFRSYKYTFLTSFFPHQSLYYTDAGWQGMGDQAADEQGLRFYMAHRIAGRFFKNKLGLTLTEAIMYQSDDGTVNPRVFNPVDVFHNYYIRGNANSNIILEFDYSPIKKLNIYGQLIIDEFSLPGEPKGKNSSWAFPQALGFMLGAKTSFELKEGMFYSSFETLKTDPFLYLRYKDLDGTVNQKENTYGINYVVAFKEFSSSYGTSYDEYFLGYKYGGDAFVVNLNAGWKNYRNLSIEGNIFMMWHGTFDMWTNWTAIGDGSDARYPKWNLFNWLTTSHPTYNNKDNEDAQTRDAISQTLICGVNVTYKITSWAKVFAQTDYVFINNYGNHSGVRKMDFQCAFGANISLPF